MIGMGRPMGGDGGCVQPSPAGLVARSGGDGLQGPNPSPVFFVGDLYGALKQAGQLGVEGAAVPLGALNQLLVEIVVEANVETLHGLSITL